jgi:hypothetical protein
MKSDANKAPPVAAKTIHRVTGPERRRDPAEDKIFTKAVSAKYLPSQFIFQAGSMVWRRMAESIGGNIPLPTMPIRKELSITEASLHTTPRDFAGGISRQERSSRPELVLAAVRERPHIDRSSSNIALARADQTVAAQVAVDKEPPGAYEASENGGSDPEALAREVYTIIRRRLQVEKERIG